MSDLPQRLDAARERALRASRRLGLAALDYGHYLFSRFRADRCTRAASALAYTTLLALVPLLTVIFLTLSAVPAFSGWESAVESFIFDNFVPAFGETVRQYLVDFTGKARGLQAIGVVTLGVTVLLMMATIENTFNVIWRIRKQRPFVTRFLVYWAVITIGPILIGSGLVATSYVVSLPQLEGMNQSYQLERRLLAAFPVITTTVAFFLFFRVIPNRPVPFKHAFAGAVASSLMFELAKQGFAYYVKHFPGQEMIYGAFATLPLFLVWIYLSWLIVLLGAEITVCLTTFNALAPRRHRAFQTERFYAAYRMLGQLYDAQLAGAALSEKALARRERTLPYPLMSEALEALERAGWISRDEDYRWLLTRDLNRQSVAELMQIVPPPVPARAQVDLEEKDTRDASLRALFEDFARFSDERLSGPLSELLRPCEAEKDREAHAASLPDPGAAPEAGTVRRLGR